MSRMSVRAQVCLSVWFLLVLAGCSQTASLGSPATGGSSGSGGTPGPLSSGGVSGSGGSPATGGIPFIGNTGPGGQSGTGGNSGSGGSSGTGGSSTSDAGANLAELCTTTGGKISSKSCCAGLSPPDFPNSCSVGACGCAAADSKTMSTCDCGSDCFDQRRGCVPHDDGGF
jgi:hypothetical protein